MRTLWQRPSCWAVWPPSMTRACPTTKAAASEQSRTAAPAISFGDAGRPTHRDLVLHTAESAAKIGVNDPIELLLRDIRDGEHPVFDAGIIEGEVETTERLYCLVQRSFDIAGLRHVTLTS